MTKLQIVAAAIRDAGKWVTTTEIAAELDVEPKFVAALAANLKSKGMVESQPIEGSNAHLWRVKDREATDAYVLEERERHRTTDYSIVALRQFRQGDGPTLTPIISLNRFRADGADERTLAYAMEDDGTLTIDAGRTHLKLNVSEWLAVFDFLAPRVAEFAPREAA